MTWTVVDMHFHDSYSLNFPYRQSSTHHSLKHAHNWFWHSLKQNTVVVNTNMVEYNSDLQAVHHKDTCHPLILGVKLECWNMLLIYLFFPYKYMLVKCVMSGTRNLPCQQDGSQSTPVQWFYIYSMCAYAAYVLYHFHNKCIKSQLNW